MTLRRFFIFIDCGSVEMGLGVMLRIPLHRSNRHDYPVLKDKLEIFFEDLAMLPTRAHNRPQPGAD